uniref:Uncharacterized protein n=1 Tax=Anopheles atroparvus TaxID=41427 RepID=A0A182INC8_ANOAO
MDAARKGALEIGRRWDGKFTSVNRNPHYRGEVQSPIQFPVHPACILKVVLVVLVVVINGLSVAFRRNESEPAFIRSCFRFQRVQAVPGCCRLELTFGPPLDLSIGRLTSAELREYT